MTEEQCNPFPYTPIRYEFPFPKIKAKCVLASIGSCFSDDLAGLLLHSGMHGAKNPNGIVYHPLSICDSLMRLSCGYMPDDFFEFNGLWHSWSHHGSFSSRTREEILDKANESAKRFLKALKKADVFLMTCSTSVVFRHIPSRRIVANCHKVPGNEFDRFILPYSACKAAILTSCRHVRELNPHCIIILTLSPVRHHPGNLTLNARSKAQLLSAIHEVCEMVSGTTYFPAWEILNDELRDYRFYAEDMLHPSPVAFRIILERFLDSCFVPQAKQDFLMAEARRKAVAHIPLQME